MSQSDEKHHVKKTHENFLYSRKKKSQNRPLLYLRPRPGCEAIFGPVVNPGWGPAAALGVLAA